MTRKRKASDIARDNRTARRAEEKAAEEKVAEEKAEDKSLLKGEIAEDFKPIVGGTTGSAFKSFRG